MQISVLNNDCENTQRAEKLKRKKIKNEKMIVCDQYSWRCRSPEKRHFWNCSKDLPQIGMRG